jgi:2-polyprenyl-6-methoxyphenol hydroxylase-like FAD-dependent oxidoreductase
MWQRACALESLHLVDGVRVEEMRRSGGLIEVYAAGKWHAGRLLVGADGLNSQVRRLAGLEGFTRSPSQVRRWGICRHFAASPWSDFVEVHWKGGIEAYLTPTSADTVNLAILWEPARFPRQRPAGDRMLETLLSAFPELRERLRDAPWIDAQLAVGPMQRKALSPVSDGLVLMGDAAGYLDALTGEGISLALHQALAFERIIVPILSESSRKQHTLTRRDLSAYYHAYQKIVRSYYRLTNLALYFSRHPAWVEAGVGILQRSPKLFQLLLEANMRVG